MGHVEVVVPFAGTDLHRHRALTATVWQYRRRGWFVNVGRGSDPWIKAAAVMPLVDATTSDVVIVADADCIVEGDGLEAAVAAVRQGAPWAIPHRWLVRLSRTATDRFHALEEWDDGDWDEPPQIGWEGGGVVVARADTLRRIPLDPRFVGWGGEDESWALALRVLAGDPFRSKARLIHLWHPPQPRRDRRRGSEANWRLVRRYAAARNDPTRMAALIREARIANDRNAYQPTLHDPPGTDGTV